MAKLVRFEDLKEGQEYHEEWMAGTGTLKCKVIEILDETHARIRYWTMKGSAFSQIVRKGAEYRYWDSEPTYEERSGTAW